MKTDVEKQPVARVTVSVYPRTLQEVEDFAAEFRISRSRAAEWLMQRGLAAVMGGN